MLHRLSEWAVPFLTKVAVQHFVGPEENKVFWQKEGAFYNKESVLLQESLILPALVSLAICISALFFKEY